MLKGFSLVYGIFFLLLGISGFLSLFVLEGCLFDFFKVNNVSNVIHLLTGAVAIWMSFVRHFYQRIYFQIVGFIYLILTIFGFVYGQSPILGFIANNPPMTGVHLIFAVVALILGFGTKNRKLDERDQR